MPMRKTREIRKIIARKTIIVRKTAIKRMSVPVLSASFQNCAIWHLSD
jgi:hypothetical protein